MAAISQEESERRREVALRLHGEVIVDPQTGEERRRFGGPQPGSGRPRKKRAADLILEKIEKDPERVALALWENLADTVPAHIRLQAAGKVLEIEQKAFEDELREAEQLAKMERGDLVSLVLERLEKLADAGVIPPLNHDVIDHQPKERLAS